MQAIRPNNFFLFSFILFTSCITFIAADCTCNFLDNSIIIRDETSCWVVDGNWPGAAVKFIRYKPGHTDQRWLFQPSTNVGLFNIICLTTGLALDVGPLADEELDSYTATVNKLEDSPSQQWYIDSDGSIVSAYVKNHVLHPYADSYAEQNYLVLVPKRSDTSTYSLDYALEDDEVAKE